MGASAEVGTPECQEAGNDLVDKIFHKLSDDEKEQTARASSYSYLVASQSPADDGFNQRDVHARAMIGRYLAVEQKLRSKTPDAWESSALMNLRKTLQYRAEKQVDEIRLCFDKDKQSNESLVHATIRKGLTDRFATKASIVRGYTKDGIAMFQNTARADTSWEEEYYIKGNIYMMERALACTERNTKGKEDRVVIFYNYEGYGRKNNCPPQLVNQLMSDFRDHWPERLHHVFLVDAPLIFRIFWAIVKHFVDPITKSFVQFITGEEQKKMLRELVSEDHAAPYMFDGGKDGAEADMKTFFYDTPFDRVYGENHN